MLSILKWCYFAYSSRHLVQSHLGLAFVVMLRPFFPELVMSTDLLSFEYPSILLFCFVLLDTICVHIQVKIILEIHTIWTFIKIISIPDEVFFESAVKCISLYFVIIIWCSDWFCTSPLPLEVSGVVVCNRLQKTDINWQYFNTNFLLFQIQTLNLIGKKHKQKSYKESLLYNFLVIYETSYRSSFLN